MIILVIPVFERDDSKLYRKVDAVNRVESTVLEVICLGLERDVPIYTVLVGDRIQQFLAACELLSEAATVLRAIFESEQVVVEL